jgi:GNAT superfamily N-acetyltransferase
VVVTDLEMTDPSMLRSGREPAVRATLVRAGRSSPLLSRFFYRSVGGDWYWVDRLGWSVDHWRRWTETPGYELWTCWVDGVPAGYFELDPSGRDGSVEIAFFGLLPEFAGLGLGGWLLAEAARHGWQGSGATRVWVHTCTLDSPAALPNYLARGFVPCGTSLEYRDLSSPPPGPIG